MSSHVKIISIGDYCDEDVIYDHKIISSPNKYTFPSHSHDMCEFIYFVSGEASYYIEGNVYTLSAGDLVFIRSAKHHMLVVGGGADYERYVLMFSRALLPEAFYEKTKEAIEVVNITDTLLVKALFRAADVYYTSSTVGKSEYQAFLRALTTSVGCEFIHHAEKSASKGGENSFTGNETFHQALMYINKNLHSLKNIDEVCERLYITKRYLHYLFKSNLGITPKKYITEKRLLIARREIRSGKSLTEAYRAAGFTDYTSFYRNYKAYFGHSPSDENRKNDSE